MSLKSMTGFGRSAGVHDATSWHWEVRSVNGRSLELRFRMPSGLERLDVKARALAQEKLARGNVTLNLMLRRETGDLVIRLNESVLAQALAASERARGLTGMPAPGLDALLGMRGVVEVVEGATLAERLKRIPGLEVRVAEAGAADGETDGTQLFSALTSTLSDAPPDRVAGAVLITAGRVHVVPPDASTLA